MFYHFEGTLSFIGANTAVIDCGGVGYKLSISQNTLRHINDRLGDVVKLYSHLVVREDVMDLYGFYDVDEMEFFKLLISVSGVGPKTAIGMLSDLSPKAFASAIASNDIKLISKAPGIGPKTAQRLVLELKNKISIEDLVDSFDEMISGAPVRIGANKNYDEAVSALMSLGYTAQSAKISVNAVYVPELSVEELITKALKNK